MGALRDDGKEFRLALWRQRIKTSIESTNQPAEQVGKRANSIQATARQGILGEISWNGIYSIKCSFCNSSETSKGKISISLLEMLCSRMLRFLVEAMVVAVMVMVVLILTIAAVLWAFNVVVCIAAAMCLNQQHITVFKYEIFNKQSYNEIW